MRGFMVPPRRLGAILRLVKHINWIRSLCPSCQLLESGGLWVTVLVMVLLAVGLVLSIVPWDWLSVGESGSSTIRNLGLVIAGLIALPLAFWRSKVADRQAAAAERQADVAQQGLLNERYQKGAEMLGSDLPSVRLGGVYTLKRLAAEHPEHYHVQVMELFCAFVRHPTANSTEAKLNGVETGTGTEEEQQDPNPQLREDVQAVMTAIGERGKKGHGLERETNFALDLKGANLYGIRLSGADLSSADLTGTDLRGVFFPISLVATDLSEPIRSGLDQPQSRIVLRSDLSTMPSADFSSMHSLRVNFSRALLSNANLSGARLFGADLSGAQLSKANLSNAELFEANLFKAALHGADLSGAEFIHANLSDAEVSFANLSGANLSSAKLLGTNFFFATLNGVDLSGAILSEADGQYVATGLTKSQLDQTRVSPNNPPSLTGIVDHVTKEPLVWPEEA